MTRTTRAPLALLLAAVLAISAGLAAATTSPAGAAGVAARKPGPVGVVTLGDARISGSKANVLLSWRKVAGAKTYQVRWATNRAMKKARSTTVRKRSATVRGLAVGKTWCFQVRGLAGKKKGKRSAPVCLRVAKPGQSGSPWVIKQRITGTSSPRAELTLNWRATAGARAYELDYAITREPVVNYPLWENKARRTVRTSTNAAVLGNLNPGTIYCFQVRAITSGGTSDRSPTHCKVTMPADRRAPAAPGQQLSIASWNICASANACNAVKRFGDRVQAIASRINEADVDVAAIQEASATERNQLAAQLASHGYELACAAGAESVFVRTDRYSIGRHDERVDPGACWAEVEPVNGGTPVIVTSLHLKPGDKPGDDGDRRAQAARLLGWLPAGRLVLAGDTNSHRGHAVDGPRLAWEPGLRDAYDIAASFRSAPYNNSMNNWEKTPRVSTRWGTHIDRVFSSSGIHAASWQIVEPIRDGRFSLLLSDHSLVKVVLDIPTD